MTQIILEHNAAKLAGVTDRVTRCDASGNVLGYFTPAEDKSLYKDLVIPLPLTEEELRERYKVRHGYTTAEVLEHLRRLERNEGDSREGE